MNAIADFFIRNEKLIPPIITGIVTVSIFVFTIWKDRIKDKRRSKKEQQEKMLYLINLLEDVLAHAGKQMKDNNQLVTDVNADPSKFTLLTYLPPNYLDRLLAVLANDSYFAAFNRYFQMLDIQQRVKIYNDFAIDVDVLQGMMTELRRFLTKATAHYEEFHNRYIKACGKLAKAVNDLQYHLSANPIDDMDTDELLTVLSQIDTKELITAIHTRELTIVHGMVVEIQTSLLYLLRPDFSRYQSADNLHQDCEGADREYKSLVNSNKALSASIAALNNSLQDRLTTFSEKLKLLKNIKA